MEKKTKTVTTKSQVKQELMGNREREAGKGLLLNRMAYAEKRERSVCLGEEPRILSQFLVSSYRMTSKVGDAEFELILGHQGRWFKAEMRALVCDTDLENF